MSYYKFDPEDAKRFGREQGIRYRVRGDELHFLKCPYCKNLTDDKNTFAINLNTGQFRCLRASCGVKGNMLTLARDFDFSLGNDVDEYYTPKKRYRNLSNYPRPVSKDPAVAYMESRGISKAITEKYAITTQNDHDNILVFPFFDEHGKMQFVKYRKTDFDKTKDKNKEWSQRDCKPILFGMDQCDPSAGPLILTEGQIDSMSVAEAGLPNAVSVPTGAKGFTWVPYCWDFLGKFDELIVFGDHEKGSITLLDEMETRFHGSVKHVRPEDYKDCKDANDLLRKHGKEAVRKAVENATYTEDPFVIKGSAIERVRLADREAMSSGFKQFDENIGGFYFGSLVILTGKRGEGKSTMASQFLTMAINQGYRTFAYSGELTGSTFQEWYERQMAGPEHINAKKNKLNFVDYRIDYQCERDIVEWYDELLYVYDNRKVKRNQEHETLLETIDRVCRQYGCRVIFLDNLMTAMDDDLTADEYRQQTTFVKSLAEMSRQYNVIIFLIAHPRKSSSAGTFSNDDVAGSGNVTNLANLVINYAKPPKDDKSTNPGDRVLQITKNRDTGKVNYKGIPLWYNDASKRISEVYGKFDWQLGWEKPDEFKEVPEEFDLPFGD